MEELRSLAVGSVARACGFATLGISCTMVGFAHDVVRAMQAGGIMVTVMTLILMWKARTAPMRPYKRTEVWIMLDPQKRPREEHAQWAFGTVLADVYLRFAHITAGFAVALWVLALLFSLLRAAG